MKDYSLGKVYKIISNNTDLIYIGSCILELRKRLWGHKQKKISSRNVIECGEYDIVLIEKYSCNDNTELRMREQYWIDHYRQNGYNVVNKRNAYLSKEELKEYQREWNKNNYVKNKEYGNKEVMSVYQKECDRKYYEKNKEIVKSRNNEKYFMNKFGNVMSEFIISLECY